MYHYISVLIKSTYHSNFKQPPKKINLFSCIGLILITLTAFTSDMIDCLKIKSIYVPKAITIGESAWLNCSYELENDNLYSVTWFKANLHEINLSNNNNKKQFYRYVHNEIPPTSTYETPGVYIDETKSNRGSVYLYKSDLTTEGKYICEVIADSPSFQTVTRTDDMRVHYLPDNGPIIEPTSSTIGNVDFINVTCKSGPSKPKARLSWYINDALAPKQYVYDEDYLNLKEEPSNGLRSSQIRLLFPIYQNHPNDNFYRLRCESQFVQSFSEVAQILIKPANLKSINQHNANNFTSDFLVGLIRSSSGREVESINSINESIINKEGDLRVDGLRSSYSFKDRVNLTCRSGKSPVHSTPTKLTWLINDKEVTGEMIKTYPIDSLGNSALGLTFNLNQSFFNKWSDPSNDAKRFKLNLKCYALYEEILFQSSKEQTIKRITRESKSESAAVNTADQVTMSSGTGDNQYGLISKMVYLNQLITILITSLILR